MMLTKFELYEMRWNCEMARLWLENHWKHLGPEYDLSYYKREKEAEWYIDFAILVFDEAVKREKIANR
tara:strand:- start:116 stop:319 length:204 start_codon:yes stop_codon:yes gene_type:complete